MNVKELPDKVKCLYPDSLEYCVAGDGACWLNCLAAWLLLDPEQGPQLGRDFNTHLAYYRGYYKDKVAFPLSITIGGGEVIHFDEGEEENFFNMLVTSPQASFMWRESSDLIGLSNFTKMDINVTVYNNENSIVEITQEYKPDPAFPWMLILQMKTTDIRQCIS